MNTAVEETGTAQAAEKPNAKRKARVGAKGAHVAPKKGKVAKKAKTTKKTPKAAEEGAARDGSKAAKIIDLLKRPSGATLAEIMKSAGWQAHSGVASSAGHSPRRWGLRSYPRRVRTRSATTRSKPSPATILFPSRRIQLPAAFLFPVRRQIRCSLLSAQLQSL